MKKITEINRFGSPPKSIVAVIDAAVKKAAIN